MCMQGQVKSILLNEAQLSWQQQAVLVEKVRLVVRVCERCWIAGKACSKIIPLSRSEWLYESCAGAPRGSPPAICQQHFYLLSHSNQNECIDYTHTQISCRLLRCPGLGRFWPVHSTHKALSTADLRIAFKFTMMWVQYCQYRYSLRMHWCLSFHAIVKCREH